jgi:hypothetical protein
MVMIFKEIGSSCLFIRGDDIFAERLAVVYRKINERMAISIGDASGLGRIEYFFPNIYVVPISIDSNSIELCAKRRDTKIPPLLKLQKAN